eukprot:6183075-Pleurochrysis_carterae.AAC.1
MVKREDGGGGQYESMIAHHDASSAGRQVRSRHEPAHEELAHGQHERSVRGVQHACVKSALFVEAWGKGC